MGVTFVPTTSFLDDPWTRKAKMGQEATDQGERLVPFAVAVKDIDSEYLLKLVCDSGIINNPQGPKGARYAGYLTTVFGYLCAAIQNGFDEIQMSLRYMFPDFEKRGRIESMLKHSGAITMIQRGYKTETEAQITTWKINNTFWEYVTNDAVERARKAYEVRKKTDSTVNRITKDENGKKVTMKTTVEGVNDPLIKALVKKYSYMAACQTVYNDFELKTNGRIYHPLQNMCKENREALLSRFNGTNMVTVDIKSSLPRLCLMVMGKRVDWDQDVYNMLDGCEDVSRDAKKLATTITFNATNRKVYTVKRACEIEYGDMDFATAKRVVGAVDKLTMGITRNAKRLGLRLMNIEGRMQTKMLQWALENDVPWFPMHDGGHVPEYAAEAAEQRMREAIEEIISNMSFAERAEILEITEDELMQVMSGLHLKSEQPVKKQVKTSDLDDGDAAFLRQLGLAA